MAAVTGPNLGLFFDRPPINIPPKGLQDGKNFRCKNGRLESRNLGWERFGTFALNGPALLIDNFFPRGQEEKLIFGTAQDLYLYDPVSDTVRFLNPVYSTGTAAAVFTATVTGAGTLWLTNARAGDQITFGSTGVTAQNPHGNDASTKVLLHFAGVDGGTTFTNIPAGVVTADTFTASGNAQLDTADKKFGSASLLLDGTGDFISAPDSGNFTITTSPFTVDMWFKIAGGDGAALDLAGQTDAGLTAAASAWYLRRLATGQIQFNVSNGSTISGIQTTATYTTASNPGWHHIEANRSGNTLRIFIDGVLAASSTSFSGNVPDVAQAFAVGQRGSTGVPFNGWIDEFRLSVGLARHTADFAVETDLYITQWFDIQSVNSDTSITLSANPNLNLPAGGYTIRRRFADAASVQWSTDVFFSAPGNVDLWFATNGLDSVVTWNGTDTTVTSHPELGFTCSSLATFSNMMIYGNLVVGGVLKPTSIINSDVGLPLNAGSTGTGLSEEFIVYNSADPIVNLVPLGDYLVAYGNRTIVPMQFVGDPLIFIFRVAITGIGPISSYSIADFGDFHEFVGADAGYLFDGVTLKETNSHVWRDVLRQTDPMRRFQTYVHFDEEQGDLIWSLPNNSDPGVGVEGQPPTIAWVEHYLEDVGDFNGSPFSKRDFPFTATGFYERKVGLAWDDITEQWQEFNFAWNDQFFQAAFPLNLGGMYDGTIWLINQTQLANGVPLPSFVKTGRMALSSGRERDLLTRIYPFAEAQPYMLDVTLFMADFISGGMNNKGTQQFNQSLVEGQHFVVFYRRGRAAEFQFGSAAGDPWILQGWDYDKVNGGKR